MPCLLTLITNFFVEKRQRRFGLSMVGINQEEVNTFPKHGEIFYRECLI